MLWQLPGFTVSVDPGLDGPPSVRYVQSASQVPVLLALKGLGKALYSVSLPTGWTSPAVSPVPDVLPVPFLDMG